MKPSLRRAYAVICLAVLGCGGSSPRLNESFEPRLSVDVAEGAAKLSISVDECSFFGTARMNDVELVQLHGGRSAIGGTLIPQAVCDPPSWEIPLPLPTESKTTFEVFDETGRLVLVAQELAAPRSVELAPGQPDSVRWGDTVELIWSPLTDFPSPTVELRRPGQRSSWVGNTDYSARVRRVSFVLPPSPPEGLASGPIEVAITAGTVRVGIERCDPDPKLCSVFLRKELPPPGSDASHGRLSIGTLPLTIE